MSSKTNQVDYVLLIVVALLLILGVIALASVSAVQSMKDAGTPNHYLFRQLFFGLLIGGILGFIAFKTPLQKIKRLAGPLVLANLFLMMLVFIPSLGVSAGGASRWLDFRLFSFQPSEFLKITFIVYLATWLAGRTKNRLSKKDAWEWKSTLLPFLGILGFVVLLLISQRDASTLILTLIVGVAMYFTTTLPFWHIGVLIFGGLAVGGILLAVAPYRMNRILVMLGKINDPMGLGYQVEQALIAIGSGGFWGLGLGMSNQKFGGLLPETMSDSIFAVFAEEGGFLLSFFLVSLFLLFFWKCFQISRNTTDRFSKLFAIGLGTWICVQAFINMGAMMKIMPLTGIPLPFISYGGSHMVAELIAVGILFNISRSNISKSFKK